MLDRGIPDRHLLISLQALRNFKPFVKAIDSVSLVEASSNLREAQRKLLCGDNPFEDTPNGQKSISKYSGIPIEWVEDIRLLNSEKKDSRMPFFVAHEFFDALPIHAFRSIPQPLQQPSQVSTEEYSSTRRPSGPQWRELVVASNPNAEFKPGGEELEFQLSVAKAANPNSVVLPETSERYKALKAVPDAYIEISPESQKYVQDLTHHIAGSSGSAKGAALIIDYGPMSTVPINSLRGIQSHKSVSPFASPGQVDISADVDFTALAEAALQASPDVEVYGPVEQGHFLQALGIEDRAKQLLGKVSDETKKQDIDSAWKRLIERSGGGMGRIYKALAIVPESGGRRRPVGFGGDVSV